MRWQCPAKSSFCRRRAAGAVVSCWTYLQAHDVPFTRIDLESPEGQALAAQYDLRASPGILVDGVSVNPFELLRQPACRVDEERVQALLRGGEPTDTIEAATP